jgi:hypothetical protein
MFLRPYTLQVINMSTWQKYLKDIYYNPANPVSFSGPEKLFHFVQKDGK